MQKKNPIIPPSLQPNTHQTFFPLSLPPLSIAMASPPQFVTIILSEYCPADNPDCQPPPPPPFSDDDNGTSIQIRDHHPNHLMTSFLIAAGSLLGLSFLLLLVFSAVLLRRRRLRLQQRNTPPPATDDAEPETEGGEGDTHHVWYIRTVGLDESIIASIASAEYKSATGEGGGEDCAVCLGEFMDGEMVKMLPKCTHSFHVSCIDTWLRTHVNCPLCRAPVLLAEPTPADAAADPNDVQLDISDSPAISQTGTSNLASSLAGDLGDKSFQPVRRSVSVDSSTLAALLLRIEVHGKKPGYSQQRMLISEGADLGKGLRKGPLAMKRSQSTRSGRFFFARCGRSRNNSILPL